MSRKPSERNAIAARKNGKLGGRPATIDIDWEEFDRLVEIQCTAVEIAAWFRCSVDRLDELIRKQHGMGYAEYYKKQSPKGLISLRRAQFQTALEGNATMQIWLGKQKLGQLDDVKRYEVEISKALESVPTPALEAAIAAADKDFEE